MFEGFVRPSAVITNLMGSNYSWPMLCIEQFLTDANARSGIYQRRIIHRRQFQIDQSGASYWTDIGRRLAINDYCEPGEGALRNVFEDEIGVTQAGLRSDPVRRCV